MKLTLTVTLLSSLLLMSVASATEKRSLRSSNG